MRGRYSRMTTEVFQGVTVDYLPQPIRYHPRYTHRRIEHPHLVPLETLRNWGNQPSFADLFRARMQGKAKVVVSRMYHWTDGEDLRMEDLTHGRLYLSHNSGHWAPKVANGQALFELDCRFDQPVHFGDMSQPYEHVWRRLEDRLEAIHLQRDALFYTPATVEPPQGFVYDARKSILAIRYIGTAV